MSSLQAVVRRVSSFAGFAPAVHRTRFARRGAMSSRAGAVVANPSIERTVSGVLRTPPTAAHVERWARVKIIMLLNAMALVHSYQLIKLLLLRRAVARRIATLNPWRASAPASSVVAAKPFTLRKKIFCAARGVASTKCATSAYESLCPTVRSIRPAPTCRLGVKCGLLFINRLPSLVGAGGLA